MDKKISGSEAATSVETLNASIQQILLFKLFPKFPETWSNLQNYVHYTFK